jgi:hypothetical protein
MSVVRNFKIRAHALSGPSEGRGGPGDPAAACDEPECISPGSVLARTAAAREGADADSEPGLPRFAAGEISAEQQARLAALKSGPSSRIENATGTSDQLEELMELSRRTSGLALELRAELNALRAQVGHLSRARGV